MTTPPIPTQRKLKLLAILKTNQTEQCTRLQSKHHMETELLEDIRCYTKLRASAEKDYAQALLKITNQSLAKFQIKDENKEEDIRLPYGLWRRILKETESLANCRMKISQTLSESVTESIKGLKSDRVTTVKKCSTIFEKIQEELQTSASELVKSQKTYNDMEKLTLQTKDSLKDAEERLKKGNIGLFSSKAKLEKAMSKAAERYEVAEKRSTVARNEYLLTLAAINSQQRKYYSSDIPNLISLQDGNVYTDIRNFYTIITSADIEAFQQCMHNFQQLEGEVSLLERGYAFQHFLNNNQIFTECDDYNFVPLSGDNVTSISQEFGANLHLNKEARKWALRLMREKKMLRKKNKELKNLKASLTTFDLNSTNVSDTLKAKEQNIDSVMEEIRHIEVLRTKAEGRVEALRLAGVNVDEWAIVEEKNEVDDDKSSDGGQDYFFNDDDEDDYFQDEWEEPSVQCSLNSDDTHSTASSYEHKSLITPAVAMYAFQATSQEELSIAYGEELDIIEKDGDGWCKTRNRSGHVGYVPEAYVEVTNRKLSVSSEANSQPNSMTSDIYQEIRPVVEITAPENQQTELDILCLAKAVYDYEACEDEELSFNEGDVIKVTSKMVDDDDGWWEGIFGDKLGVFPNIVVEEIEESS